MAKERLVSEVQLDSFNLPMYIPYPEEILEVVERNKCFSVEKIELFKPVYDIVDVRTSMQAWAMHLRAGLTGMLKKYFGNETIDELFDQFFKKSQEFSCRVQAGSAEFHHVPEEILDRHSPAWNNGTKIIYTNAPDEVCKGYATQFAKDMKILLDAGDLWWVGL
ncbi:hypothetical protein JCGZ_04775 [Jatropha curcas]|uniref:Uncharacterized protein n=1 Tax=Jatropha curcas TaxID=180498 RepID=A0A067KPR7_JATCU|nr:hypothetical protein JCGZ_04775 [Jatropha curcas]